MPQNHFHLFELHRKNSLHKSSFGFGNSQTRVISNVRSLKLENCIQKKELRGGADHKANFSAVPLMRFIRGFHGQN